MSYHCPECGKEIGFGESICPNCSADVTGVWEQATQQKKSGPKIAPGMGGFEDSQNSPFPPPANNAGSPFPPPANNAGSPFPPPANQDSSLEVKGTYYLDIQKTQGKLYIQEGELRIGRDEIQGSATIALPDLNAYKNISRKRENSEHFILRNNDGNVIIEDRGSTNGTYIGTEKITGTGPRQLKEGDKIVLPIEEHGKMVQLELILKKNQ